MRLGWIWVIIDSEKRILLLKRSNYTKAFPLAWTLPWWRWKKWETPEEITIREVKEETWLDFIPKKLFHKSENMNSWENRFLWSFSWKIKIQEEADWYAWYTYEETKKLQIAFDYVDVLKKLYKEWLIK